MRKTRKTLGKHKENTRTTIGKQNKQGVSKSTTKVQTDGTLQMAPISKPVCRKRPD